LSFSVCPDRNGPWAASQHPISLVTATDEFTNVEAAKQQTNGPATIQAISKSERFDGFRKDMIKSV
jgi:hypothetical protein